MSKTTKIIILLLILIITKKCSFEQADENERRLYRNDSTGYYYIDTVKTKKMKTTEEISNKKAKDVIYIGRGSKWFKKNNRYKIMRGLSKEKPEQDFILEDEHDSNHFISKGFMNTNFIVGENSKIKIYKNSINNVIPKRIHTMDGN